MMNSKNIKKILWIIFLLSFFYQCAVSLIYELILTKKIYQNIGVTLNIILLLTVFVCYLVEKKEKEQTFVAFVKENLFTADKLLLVLFFGWCYFACFRNMLVKNAVSMGSNQDVLIWIATKIGIFYLFAVFLKGDRKIIDKVFRVLIIVSVPFICFILVGLIIQERITLRIPFLNLFVDTHLTDAAGWGWERLHITIHPNFTGMYIKTLLMICVYLFFETKSKCRYWYIPAFLIFYIALAITDSRGSGLSTAIGLSLIAMVYCWNTLKKRQLWLRVIATLFSVIIVFLIADYVRKPIMYGYRNIRMTCLGQEITEAVNERELTQNLTGRQVIYKAVLNGIIHDKEVALFGVTPNSVTSFVKQEMGWSTYTHNDFLEIATAVGIPGLFIYLCWLIYAGCQGAKVFFNKEGLYDFPERVLMVVCLTEVVNNFVEAWLTMRFSLSGSVFYLTAGYAVVLAKRLKEKKPIEAIE